MPFKEVLAAGRKLPFKAPPVGPDDIAFLQYTGGTTGVAKGAMLLHRNMVANVLQVEAWNEPSVKTPPLVEQMIIVTALPLYHVFALTACFLFGVRVGGMCLLITNPRDIGGLIKELSKYKVNVFPAVNTLYNALLHHPRFRQDRLEHAQNARPAAAWRCRKRWPTPGSRRPASRSSKATACRRPRRCSPATAATSRNGPAPSACRCRRPKSRSATTTAMKCRIGEHGEICARGPQVMPGYWHRPDETAKVMTADGFFRTGDIGVMDEQGRVRIVDRKKDMISVSGFKVFPNEVEDVAMSQGGLLECAVVGVPDAHSGEAPKLFAVKKKPDVTEAELRKFMAEGLAGYKVPSHIEFRDELPKTNVGKILRRALRDETTGEAARK